MRNKRFVLTLFVVACALLLSSFAFASFSSTLNISGTVKGEGSFDVYFATSKDGYYKADDVLLPETDGATVTVTGVSADDDGLDGGAYDKLSVKLALDSTDTVDVTFPVYVYNNGTVPAIIDVTSPQTTDVFTVTTTQEVTVPVGDRALVNVRITSNGTLTKKSYTGITLEIIAKQETVASAPSAAHDHSGQ